MAILTVIHKLLVISIRLVSRFPRFPPKSREEYSGILNVNMLGYIPRTKTLKPEWEKKLKESVGMISCHMNVLSNVKLSVKTLQC